MSAYVCSGPKAGLHRTPKLPGTGRWIRSSFAPRNFEKASRATLNTALVAVDFPGLVSVTTSEEFNDIVDVQAMDLAPGDLVVSCDEGLTGEGEQLLEG